MGQRADLPSKTEMNGNHSRNIMIVDDHIDAAESLSEFLKALGHVTHIAHDGKSALQKASCLQPEIVILDIGMPGMNGYQVAQLLRSEVGLTSAVLIAVSGFVQESDRIAAQAASFDHHFAKPIDIPRLIAVLNRAR
jgi:CheY-like chemotaxis protein